MWPTYYAADLGEYPLCSLYTTTDAKLVFAEFLYCACSVDWTLKVWGPRTATVAKDADFAIYVTGVAMPATQTPL